MLRSNSQEGYLELWVNETGSDYLLFWRDKRTTCGYFKLAEIRHFDRRIQ